MNLYKNMLLEWSPAAADCSPRVDRILAISAPNSDVVLIDIFNEKANPRMVQMDVLEEGITANSCRVLSADPFAVVEPAEESIPGKHKEQRERALKAISPIIQLPGTGPFFGRERGSIIKRTAADLNLSKRLIYCYLRKYWQRGQRPNALLPDYDRCGAPGKERKATDRKRGRPPEFASELGPGINIGTRERELILRGYKLFFLNKTGPRRSLRSAYELTIAQFFNRGHRIERGQRTPVMPAAQELPTLRQFRYWCAKENFEERLVRRDGQRRFDLRHRGVSGDARAGAHGPGSEYQIDATPADISLVSSLDRRRVIGRPTVYFVTDVFSGMIAGFSVTMENNSYWAAALALENAALDKVEYCAQLGISIESREWPCVGLPEKLTADRGELISHKAGNLVTGLGIQVTNTPPYRADLKPFVERAFRSLNEELVSLLPGGIPKPRERGERDTRLDAVLTPDEFRQAVVFFILNHNRSRVEKMKPREFVLSGDVEPRPVALWNWGLVNRSGHLRQFDPKLLRVNLLPSELATVTENGIRFRKLYFTTERAISEQWFTRARVSGSWKVDFAFDPRRASVAYIRDGKTAEPCKLVQPYDSFENCTWDEVDDYFAAARKQKSESRSSDIQSDALAHTRLAVIALDATRKTEAALSGAAAPSVKGIRASREAEKAHERTVPFQDATALDQGRVSELSSPLHPDANDHVAPVWDFDSLRKIRNEQLEQS